MAPFVPSHRNIWQYGRQGGEGLLDSGYRPPRAPVLYLSKGLLDPVDGPGYFKREVDHGRQFDEMGFSRRMLEVKYRTICVYTISFVFRLDVGPRIAVHTCSCGPRPTPQKRSCGSCSKCRGFISKIGGLFIEMYVLLVIFLYNIRFTIVVFLNLHPRHWVD